MKHTKAPWRYELEVLCDGINDDLTKINPRTITDYYKITAGEGFWRPENNVKGFGLTGYMSEANARLIAAAPDLLEALEKLLDHVTVDKLRTNWEDVIKLTTAAVAKAKGVPLH